MIINGLRARIVLAFILGACGVQQAVANKPARRPNYPSEKLQSERSFRDVPVAQLSKGSPEWVYTQAMLAARKRDFEALANYQSPCAVRDVKSYNAESLRRFTALQLETTLRMDDIVILDDRCYGFMGFQQTGSDYWRLGYQFFLKQDGNWILVNRGEWRSGVMSPLPEEGSKEAARIAYPTSVYDVRPYADFSDKDVGKLAIDYLRALQSKDYETAKKLSSGYEYHHHQNWVLNNQPGVVETISKLRFETVAVDALRTEIETDRAAFHFRLKDGGDERKFGSDCGVYFLEHSGQWVVVHFAEWTKREFFPPALYPR